MTQVPLKATMNQTKCIDKSGSHVQGFFSNGILSGCLRVHWPCFKDDEKQLHYENNQV